MNSESISLKSELKNLNANVLNINLDKLTDRMLDNIGSIDPELRDTLIYNSFGKLIMEDDLTTKQMVHIFETCLGNLFLGIGKVADDSVFTRSFSALVLVLILKKDGEAQFLSDGQLKQVIEESIKYLNLEKDVRGYVDGKGWAHSIAHGADLLTEAIRHRYFKINLSSKCLETIKLCLFKDHLRELPYVDEEEERLIFSVEALQEKGVTDSEVENWIRTISEELHELLEKEGYSLNFFRKKSNVVNFLRGFYFRLLYKNDCLELRGEIAKTLEQLHIQIYN